MRVGSADSGCGCSGKSELGSAEELFEKLAGRDGQLTPQELFKGLTNISGQNGDVASFDAEEATKLLNAAGVPDGQAEDIFEGLAQGRDEIPLTDVLDVAFNRIGDNDEWNFDQFSDVLGDIQAAGQVA